MARTTRAHPSPGVHTRQTADPDKLIRKARAPRKKKTVVEAVEVSEESGSGESQPHSEADVTSDSPAGIEEPFLEPPPSPITSPRRSPITFLLTPEEALLVDKFLKEHRESDLANKAGESLDKSASSEIVEVVDIEAVREDGVAVIKSSATALPLAPATNGVKSPRTPKTPATPGDITNDDLAASSSPVELASTTPSRLPSSGLSANKLKRSAPISLDEEDEGEQRGRTGPFWTPQARRGNNTALTNGNNNVRGTVAQRAATTVKPRSKADLVASVQKGDMRVAMKIGYEKELQREEAVKQRQRERRRATRNKRRAAGKPTEEDTDSEEEAQWVLRERIFPSIRPASSRQSPFFIERPKAFATATKDVAPSENEPLQADSDNTLREADVQLNQQLNGVMTVS